jgi:hypothetical protein
MSAAPHGGDNPGEHFDSPPRARSPLCFLSEMPFAIE